MSGKLQSVNPATGEVITTYTPMKPAETAQALQWAARAFKDWSSLPFAERAEPMRRLAVLLRERKEELAVLMAGEMGKAKAEGIAEAEKCADACDYYAERAESMLADLPLPSDAAKSYASYRPLGPVLAVMPWNFPFWQVIRFAAPALMAGNVALLKHASNTMGCALACEKLFRDAGFEPGAFQSLLLGSDAVAGLIADNAIRAVTLTGSAQAGREIAAQAGRHLKKTVLELGGSDAYVILDDADLEQAAKICARSRLINNGQSCIAAKRFIVTPRTQKPFTELFLAELTSHRTGDPLSPGVALGPMARAGLRDALHKQVEASVAQGARALAGGKMPEGPGAFYPPTLLVDVAPGMPAYSEELFGPVAALIAAHDEEDAIRIANDSSFGLGAALFSRDTPRAEALARDALEAGSCFVNALVKSDPRLPFGGIKESGYGRELSHFGIAEFVNIKTVYVA